MLLSGLLWCLGLLPLGILAALDDKTKLANKTIDRTVSLRTHSIYAPYIDQDLQNRWWDFGADAYVGWLWSRVPLTSSNFVLEVEFKSAFWIHPIQSLRCMSNVLSQISSDSSHLYGDGLAIWVTKDRAQPGSVFGSVGQCLAPARIDIKSAYVDNFEGLGIFLDTYANSRHPFSFPRITAMVGDGKTSYDQAHDGDANSLGACSANYRRTNVATKIKITYLREQYLNYKACKLLLEAQCPEKLTFVLGDDWTDCFTVHGITLPLAPYVGFSAMTGDVSDNHDIISVTTYSAVLSSPDAQRDKLGGAGKGKSVLAAAPGWTWTIIKVVLFLGVCAGVLVGYKTWVLKQAGGPRYGRFSAMGGRGPSFGGGLYADSKRF
ncbi:hypothetical protein A0H81_10231 [Grifola frondosa]|uniref:L-type lectin-like domain-containing protein n=1 Tax=Grifola frondosa TaxID=5627 RepID=A0A1C7LYJ0_GRIFR|nr:hypothetical protein A0H81_10231 [Grifola frondosa]